MTWGRSISISVGAALVGLGLAWAAGAASVTIMGLPLPALCVAVAFGMQWIAFVPASLARTEHFYDLWGSFTYLACVGVAIGSGAPLGHRGWLVGALICLWALRLGSFLFLRVRKDGGDGRFDEIKVNAPRFLVAWSLQGLWVSTTLLAAMGCMGTREPEALGLRDAIGLMMWIAGFAIESVSDEQKRRFRKSKSKDGFITTGLWAWSRHPNYFGEILLWTGIAVIASTSMTGLAWLGLVSPLFVFCLLRFGSGIPILETRADSRYAHLESYQTYKKNTPVLMLWPPR